MFKLSVLNKTPFLYTKQKVTMKNMPQGKRPTVQQKQSDRNKSLKENSRSNRNDILKKKKFHAFLCLGCR